MVSRWRNRTWPGPHKSAWQTSRLLSQSQSYEAPWAFVRSAALATRKDYGVSDDENLLPDNMHSFHVCYNITTTLSLLTTFIERTAVANLSAALVTCNIQQYGHIRPTGIVQNSTILMDLQCWFSMHLHCADKSMSAF
jgi:hypothetical protein